MAKKALIVWGGWAGHEPEKVAGIQAKALKSHGFDVELSNTLDSFLDKEKLKTLDLIVPNWTMDTLGNDQCRNVSEAVQNGIGLGGMHGGMCDAFRVHTDWQFMTGGQFVGHPGNNIQHTVRITGQHFITQGLSDFEVMTEMYYMHVDPAIRVLADMKFPVSDGPHVPNGTVYMPVTWTKHWGKGRVFYCSLGHSPSVIELPPVLKMMTRGLLWAANAESSAS